MPKLRHKEAREVLKFMKLLTTLEGQDEAINEDITTFEAIIEGHQEKMRGIK